MTQQICAVQRDGEVVATLPLKGSVNSEEERFDLLNQCAFDFIVSGKLDSSQALTMRYELRDA